jgi:hypothetical protein
MSIAGNGAPPLRDGHSPCDKGAFLSRYKEAGEGRAAAEANEKGPSVTRLAVSMQFGQKVLDRGVDLLV